MLKDLLRKLKLLTQSQQQLDLTKFNDPLALTVEWTPNGSGGTNFRTHKLVEIDFSRVEFKAATGAKFFYSIFFFAGLFFGIGFAFQDNILENFSVETIAPVLFSLLFVIIGGLLYYFGTAPIVFDKQVGYFWKGRKSPQDSPQPGTIKKVALLEDIHALQLVSEYVSGSKSSYYSYELNLVLNDGKRLTVVDHGNLLRLREDALKLAQFLGKPIWDAI
jgi:hypothetical protein